MKYTHTLVYLTITLSLFATMPTFGMRAIASRLTQRGYATMAHKDFTKLLDNKQLSPEKFASELTITKADKEEINKVLADLAMKVKTSEETVKSYEFVGDVLLAIGLWCNVASFVAMGCSTFLDIEIPTLLEIGCPALVTGMGMVAAALHEKEKLQINKATLTNIASLIEHDGGKVHVYAEDDVQSGPNEKE